jgi:hypothetical protein
MKRMFIILLLPVLLGGFGCNKVATTIDPNAATASSGLTMQASADGVVQYTVRNPTYKSGDVIPAGVSYGFYTYKSVYNGYFYSPIVLKQGQYADDNEGNQQIYWQNMEAGVKEEIKNLVSHDALPGSVEVILVYSQRKNITSGESSYLELSNELAEKLKNASALATNAYPGLNNDLYKSIVGSSSVISSMSTRDPSTYEVDHGCMYDIKNAGNGLVDAALSSIPYVGVAWSVFKSVVSLFSKPTKTYAYAVAYMARYKKTYKQISLIGPGTKAELETFRQTLTAGPFKIDGETFVATDITWHSLGAVPNANLGFFTWIEDSYEQRTSESARLSISDVATGTYSIVTSYSPPVIFEGPGIPASYTATTVRGLNVGNLTEWYTGSQYYSTTWVTTEPAFPYFPYPETKWGSEGTCPSFHGGPDYGTYIASGGTHSLRGQALALSDQLRRQLPSTAVQNTITPVVTSQFQVNRAGTSAGFTNDFIAYGEFSFYFRYTNYTGSEGKITRVGLVDKIATEGAIPGDSSRVKRVTMYIWQGPCWVAYTCELKPDGRWWPIGWSS